MASFPRIQSPCPNKARLSEVMDGDFCRACERTVIDLTHWREQEKEALMKTTVDKICVSWRPALAAAAMAAGVGALPAAAQDLTVSVAASADVSFQEPVDDYYDDEIVVGGITDPKKAVFVEVKKEATPPELPVVVEEKKPVSPPDAP